jgi:hypothetical protein
MKILLFDIETAPNLGYTWGKYEQNIVEFQRNWYLLCFAYKWLDEKQTHVVALPDFKLFKRDKENDKHVTKALWDLFNEADIIIAHNGNSFDIKKCNTQFLMHGLVPPSPSKYIDTKLVAKRYFKFDSNKLDDLGEYLGVGRKVNTGGFELWKGCMRGDVNAWRKMRQYNKQDVVLLEKIYLKMRGWIDTHPHVRVFLDARGKCAPCGSSKIIKRGFGISGKAKRVQRLQCQDCGAWTQVPILK